ncbi:sigma 54-interacting transcriptional regulator [Sporomusa sp.]|uniref:sigma 54-interacting transcriptional regulator n=1 Tax=Sporomusa sp. TaxID=2078658 RepID=UPI002CD93DF3|nr:sigma 54-interacting transcriptional regulator [Sporomusa sp.]HWR43581.1 sigma 54-interacting transcriptional regulator [Sporomusa sp.]
MTPILFLAPFPGMADLATAIADKMGVRVIVEVTDDAHVKSVVKKYTDAEVIVSRGGVAEQVRSFDNVSVVEITMSVNDLLSVLSRLTGQGLRRIGIVSRANLFDGTMGDFCIADTEVYIRSCIDEQEIQQTVLQFFEQRVEAVIGCRMAYETAKECGLVAELLDSSAVSVKKAIEEAVRILKAKEREKLQAAQLMAIIDNIEEGVIAVTDDKKVSFYNTLAKRICTEQNKKLMFSHIAGLLNYRNQEKIVTIKGNSVLARVIPLEFNNKKRGDVITFQEVSSIQAFERKIRFSSYQKGLYAKRSFNDIIGQSAAMNQLITKAKNYANYNSNLLIYGETGTGKEVLAQSVHNHSKCHKGPFVSVNTASIPPSLLESELFGYAEGAFTGARKGGKQGLFELAHGGTIFLDEIGELTPEIQSRLLRVLQEKEIMRIGDDKIIPVDVRIISATNRDLFEQVKTGAFRQDLYYRIHVLGLRIPPLRERAEDIPLIFDYYVKKISAKEGKSVKISAGAMKVLTAYSWPGNIRQLRNIAEVVAYCGYELIEPEHIADVLLEQETRVENNKYITIPEGGSLKQMEAEIIKCLLAKNTSDEVCRQLGISRVTLWRKTKDLFQN